MQQSVIRDIFSGVVKTDLTVEGSNKPSVTYEPFYILNLEIPRDTGDLQSCLKSFFEEKRILDYMHNGKRVRATHKSLISKLPRILCLHLKRFIYTDHLIKMKYFVTFEEVIEINDNFLASQLRIGRKHEYRLFSVVEHVGQFASRGHYISYTLDSEN